MHRLQTVSKVILAALLILFNFVMPDAVNPDIGTPGLNVVRITPAGMDVPPGRQIVIEFNREVVPVGRMERGAAEIPITISPGLDCRWRWLNTRALACRLDESDALKPATRYDIVVNPGIRTEDGATLSEPVLHWFITERPKVRHAWFRTWKAPGMPLIRLTFNQPVLGESVEKHVFMMMDVPDEQRIGLKVEPDPDDMQTPLILPLPGEKIALVPDNSSSDRSGSVTATLPADHGTAARRVWLISPIVEIAPDTQVTLNVTPGLVSFSGPERGVENRVLVVFHTFPEFTFEGIECTDNTNKKITVGAVEEESGIKERCHPLRQVALVFSAPVVEEAVKDHVSFVPDLAGGRKDYDPWANRRGYSRLRSPHQKGRKYRVWLPEVLQAYQMYTIQSDPLEFKDEFGRTLPASIDMQFATDHRPADFTLTHPRAVLEKDLGSEVPLVVTNLKNDRAPPVCQNREGR